ncbi:murein L,D-transpeptidase catalytic domain family protein [Hymenobacter sp. ASUV-10]|uniref:Murein L,D-transpeptidase catalytic domain family protein n=1 Tax=Hymenobacter aranciens TaxID=3063996 RepID=A0ABT9B627_9BACT|nr:murein L,D-transpeptidase catalytic domain family protein [Hymenobacter sp. ASUV-10]MDO7873602.1 murein L,D-transpeptidase catalytic domain family protein [Hymenobacter sp. ASUV-10]
MVRTKYFLLSSLTLLGVVGKVSRAQAQKVPAAALAALPAAARQAVYQTTFEQRAAQLYAKLKLGTAGLSLAVFRQALVGYYNLQPTTTYRAAMPVLTLIDFARPSALKRLWVIDIAAGKVLFNTLVAHGKNSGENLPLAFSNQNGSEMSSLGFYRTASTTYNGKHGLSLKLVGLDPGFNTNAESRAVVMHGAEYVCEEFVRQHGRLGRSQGCPALPVAETPAIVQTIKGGSILYLHGPAQAGYHSQWLDESRAVEAFARQEGLLVKN